MKSWAWILVWVAVIAVIAFFWLRERRAGKNRINFDADAPRGQADAEARMRSQARGPNTIDPTSGF